MTPLTLFFTLAAIGIAETAYLIRKRKASERPICPMGGNCELVLSSTYNKLFGIHNDLLGFAFYLSVSILAGLIVIGVEPLPLWNMLILASVTVGTVLSIRFTYLQARVLRAWCTWCLLSACTIFAMAVILLLAHFDLTTLL